MYRAVLLFTLILLPQFGHAQIARNIQYYAGFESGQVLKPSSLVDGMNIKTLTNPQIGDAYVSTNSMGGAGPTTNWDTKVVKSESVGGQTVLPRSGSYFLRSSIYYTKDYLNYNNGDSDKPRMLATNYTANTVDFDEEAWVGFSIFLPKNWEHELGVRDHRGGDMLFVVNAETDSTFLALHPYVPPGETVTHWKLLVQTDNSSAYESSSAGEVTDTHEWVDLGSVVPDLGKWTDFVIRFRVNPFSVATNPATKGIKDSMNKTYQGNRGILQVWKSEGVADTSGTRPMVQKINKVNVPVGLVPHATEKLRMDLRQYKYGWKKNPTTVTGPVWVGFDEFRFGITSRDGTGFKDVAPSGTASSPTNTSTTTPSPVVTPSGTGKNYSVSASTASVDCASFSGGVKPGDTLTLTSGVRGPLTIRNCIGTASNPIKIQNSATGQTVIQRTSGNAGGFVFVCDTCINTIIDGTVKWPGVPSGKSYGIKVTMTGGGSPSAFVKIGGKSRFLTLRGVEVDGKWPSLADNGIGISVNDHTVLSADNPGLWREGITIEKSYVHDIEGEGMYVGPNWYQNDLRLRNINIQDNLIERTGWDGINLKSTIQGTNDIHHNVLRNVGLYMEPNPEPGQRDGIALFEGGGRIYNNWVENTGENGIAQYNSSLPSSYGTQSVEIFNNVVINTGITGPLAGKGIASGSKDDSATANTSPKIYNNTVIGTEAQGIMANSQVTSGFIRDNVIADADGSPVSAPSSVTVSNNRTGTKSALGFVNPTDLNFRLKSTSPAYNAGSKTYPATDIADVVRVKDGASDQGAYEGSTGLLLPSSPSTSSVTPATTTPPTTKPPVIKPPSTSTSSQPIVTGSAKLKYQNDFETGWGDVLFTGFCPKRSDPYKTLFVGNGDAIPTGHEQFLRTKNQARSGVFSARVALDPKYACYDEIGRFKIRSEIYMTKSWSSAYKFVDDVDHWYGFSIFIDANNALSNPPYTIMTQIRPGSGISNALKNTNGNWEYYFEGVSGGQSTGLLGAIQKGKWTDFVFHLRPSHTKNGVVEIWINGVKKYSKTGLDYTSTNINGETAIAHSGVYYGNYGVNYAKYGDKNLPFIVYIDSVKIAQGSNGYALVAPSGTASTTTPPVTTPPPTATTTPTTCTNLLTPTTAIPASYGASYNLFSTAKEYLVQGTCSGTATQGTVTVGNGESTTRVYNKGYYYAGGTMVQYSLTCAGAVISDSWCLGKATASIPFSTASTDVLGYTCEYVSGTWKCGCRDTTCTTNYWQMQRIQRVGR